MKIAIFLEKCEFLVVKSVKIEQKRLKNGIMFARWSMTVKSGIPNIKTNETVIMLP